MIKFITGNSSKFNEVSAILAPMQVKQIKADLDEIQELDSYKIIRHKLNEAFKLGDRNILIDDTSVFLGAFKNQLPGPFMKWFLKVVKLKELYLMAKKLGNTKAEMRTIIAYAESKKKIHFFEGVTKGIIVNPSKMGAHGFAFDPIFKPNGSNKTLAELKSFGGSKFSARNKAAIKLKKFLLKNGKSNPKK